MRPAWLAVAAVVALLAALPALAAHVQRYEFEWRETTASQFAQGYAEEGTAAQVNFTLPENLTRVTVRLVWTDDLGAPDDFHVAVDGPAGHGENAGASGELEVIYQLGVAPVGNWSVEAPDEPSARARSEATHPGDPSAGGVWFVTVYLRDAGDGGFFFDERRDLGNDWRLEVAWEGYEAALLSVAPLVDAAPPPELPPPGEEPVAPPSDGVSRPAVPAVGGKGLGLLLFAGMGVGLWAVVARWRRQGRLE